MIKKYRNISMELRELKALTRRVRAEHHKYPLIIKEYGIKHAGYKGEQSLDFYLKSILDSNLPFFLYQDLRLPYNKNSFFQIDTLLLFTSFVLNLEVKNYRGTLSFDPMFQQVIQEVENIPTISLPDPILQVNMQEERLRKWFEKKSLPLLPIESLIVMVNQKSVIKVLSHHSLVEKYVIKGQALNNRIMKLIKKYPNSILSQKDLRRVSSHLLKGDIPLERSPVNRFGITAKDIIPGVFCQECTPISVIQRIYGGWKCPRCALISLNAHLPALEDYALTINPFIGIKELQEFLQLKNPYIARRVIQSLDPEFICNTKGRKYKIPIF